MAPRGERVRPREQFLKHAAETASDERSEKSLRQVLKTARSSGHLVLADRRLRELPVEA